VKDENGPSPRTKSSGPVVSVLPFKTMGRSDWAGQQHVSTVWAAAISWTKNIDNRAHHYAKEVKGGDGMGQLLPRRGTRPTPFGGFKDVPARDAKKRRNGPGPLQPKPNEDGQPSNSVDVISHSTAIKISSLPKRQGPTIWQLPIFRYIKNRQFLRVVAEKVVVRRVG